MILSFLLPYMYHIYYEHTFTSTSTLTLYTVQLLYFFLLLFVLDKIVNTLRKNGNVLICVDTAGRVLELSQLLVTNDDVDYENLPCTYNTLSILYPPYLCNLPATSCINTSWFPTRVTLNTLLVPLSSSMVLVLAEVSWMHWKKIYYG